MVQDTTCEMYVLSTQEILGSSVRNNKGLRFLGFQVSPIHWVGSSSKSFLTTTLNLPYEYWYEYIT